MCMKLPLISAYISSLPSKAPLSRAWGVALGWCVVSNGVLHICAGKHDYDRSV